MRTILLPLFITLSLIVSFTILSAQELITYDNIPGRSPSEHYQCRVRQVGSDQWHNAFVMQTKCKHNLGDSQDNGYFQNLSGWTASWIAFEFSGSPVEVEIAKIEGAITEAMVRPVADASAAVIRDGKAYVVFNEPANINVDINGQMEDQYTGMGYKGPAVHTISIFANPVFHVPNLKNNRVLALEPGESIPADRSTWDTIYFKPGVHHIGVPWEIKSNDVLFIPGNAVVHGTIHPTNAWGSNAVTNFTVYGSGAISGEENNWKNDAATENKTFTYQSNKARMEGFVVVDPANHTFNMMNDVYEDASRKNLYKNIKIFGWRKNSDGVNAFTNSLIEDCFFRVQDDAFYYGRKVKIQNCVVWNDANGAVLFVTKGADNMEESQFKDITVIYHRAFWHYWGGGRVISFRDREPGNVIENVLIKNVLIEDPLSAFAPFYGVMNSTGSNAPIKFNNIMIDNVRQEHPAVTSSSDASFGRSRNTLLGLDATRQFENITFKNCHYNGKDLGSFEDGDFLINQFVNVNKIHFILEEVITYNLKANSVNGTITADPLEKAYEKGTVVTLTAKPDFGYRFSGWSGDVTGSNNPLTLTMDTAKNLTANFIPVSIHKLVINASNGVVTKNRAGDTFETGTEITLTATPNKGYVFSGWSGGYTGTLNPLSITMNSATEITANFIYIGWGTLEFALNCGGKAFTAADGTPYKADTFTDGSYSSSSPISGTDDDVLYQSEHFGSSFSYNLPLPNGDYEVTLMFAEIFFGDRGKRVFNVSIEENRVLEDFDIFADAGKNVAYNVAYGVSLTDGELNIDFSTVTDNAKISAIKIVRAFSGESYSLTTNAVNGTINSNPSYPLYPKGSLVSLAAMPKVGYKFSGWSGDFSGSNNPATITMDGNKTITANFVPIPYYSFTTTAVNGTIKLDPVSDSYQEGKVVALIATPNAGYEFTGWSGDLSGTNNPTSITMDSNKNVIANFTKIPTFDLTTSAVNGLVSLYPEGGSYIKGTVINVIAIADEGYRFVGWAGDLSGTENQMSITVDGNKSILAIFEKITSVNELLKNVNQLQLLQNHPNPFSVKTTIPYVITKDAHVEIIVCNLLGAKVKTLVDNYQLSGNHQVEWDTNDANGRIMPNGIYFFNFSINHHLIQTKKAVLLK